LSRVRKQQGYAQEKLAAEAGIGVATLRRIESGKDSQLESWIKLLNALRMSESINTLLPENYDSPMADALASRKRRRKKKPVATWGDESG
jgi:transcriptional regulator with XRE-family HTH domain